MPVSHFIIKCRQERTSIFRDSYDRVLILNAGEGGRCVAGILIGGTSSKIATFCSLSRLTTHFYKLGMVWYECT